MITRFELSEHARKTAEVFAENGFDISATSNLSFYAKKHGDKFSVTCLDESIQVQANGLFVDCDSVVTTNLDMPSRKSIILYDKKTRSNKAEILIDYE